MTDEMQISEGEQQSTPQFYYTIAGCNILLEPGMKTEIIEKQVIFPIPHSPPWCQGMISLRGKLIPVANLHKLLNSSDQRKSNWLLVLEKDPYPQLAIRIDKLPMQQLLDNEPRNAIDLAQYPSWLQASISVDNKVLYEADHTILFKQLIHENESPQSDFQETHSNPNQDSSGNDA